MDINNLYTNIPIEAGINCVRNMFEKYLDPKRPDKELLKLLEINLSLMEIFVSKTSLLTEFSLLH